MEGLTQGAIRVIIYVMATLIGVRSLKRGSNVRIGTTRIRFDQTATIDLDDPAQRQALAHHSSIGNVITVPLAGDFSGTTATLTNNTTNNALKVTQSANASGSTSVGGAVNVTNTGSTGAGVVIYSNRGADAAGRLLVIRNDNPANPQQSVFVDHRGTGHAVNISHTGSGLNANALLVTSTNENDTSFGISGQEVGKGTIKATHNKPPSGTPDTNASALSLRANGAGTAAQYIFADSEQVGGTTGKLVNLRQNGAEVFVVHPDGAIQMRESAAPITPAADQALIYTRDNGAGKTQVVARFATGADVVLATQA
jgi:hypothetical protein